MASRELKVEIIGDSRSLEKALGSATKSASSFGSKTSKAFKVVSLAAAGAGVAVAGGFIYTLKRGFDELAEAQKVGAQTAAVIKSTGASANVSAKQVEGYASSLSAVSGVDDEVIASGENMLLTFTNIRNETGKGNDIFKQATGTLLDMSTALGTDMNKSAIQLGKALNDPVKGITALQRVGVSFTEGQKATIASMVKSGDTMGAQKMILKELNKEFGGSAKAFGDTMPGQLSKLKNAFDEVAGEMAVKFLPILTRLVTWVNDNWASISAVFDAVGTAIVASFNAIGVAVNWLRGQWEIHRDTVIAAWQAVQDAVMRAVDFFTGSILPAIQNVISAIQAIWARFGEPIMAVLNTVFPLVIQMIKGFVQNVLAPFKILFALLRGDFGAAWDEIKGIFSRAFSLIANMLRAAVSIWLTLAKALGKAILDGIMAGLTALAGQIKRALNAGVEAVRGMVGAALSAATAVGMAILNGVKAGLSGIAGMLAAQMQKLWDAVKSAAGTAYSLALAIGKAMVQGIIDGFTSLIGSAKDKLVGGVRGIGSAIGGAIGIGSPSRWYADNIGAPMAEGIGVGFMERIGPVGDRASSAVRASVVKMGAAVTSARAELAGAFVSVFDAAAQAGLAAIDARFAGWKSPSLALADKEAAQKTFDDLTQSVNDAEAALIAADAAATAAAGTPEAEQAAKDLAAAYKTLADAEFALRQEILRRQGAQETAAQAELVTGLKGVFLERLRAIQQAWTQEKPEWQKLQKQLKELFKGYGIELGGEFGKGIKDGLIKVGSAVDELATAIANKIAGREGGGGKGEKGKARGGPVFKGGRYIVGEKGPEMFVPKQSGSIMTASQTRRFLRGGGSGGLTKSGKGVGQGESVPAAPKWANESVWQAAVAIAGSMGKLEEFIGAVNSGSYRANAGLLNGIAQNRTRWNWNTLDGWPTVRDAIDMMLPLGQGMSGAEAAEFFGWMKKGGTLPGDGLYYGHKGETVIPLDRSMGQTVNVYVSGYVGNERQLARELAPAFMEETRKRQGKGAPPITRVR